MIVVIGTGLAGYQFAREFRKINLTTPLTLITADDGTFYTKPQLSSAFTLKKTAATLASVTADAMASQLNARILTHQKVSAIDPVSKTVFFDGEKLSYEKLVLACGADVLKAPLLGDGVPEVLSINHLYHYAEFEKLIKNKKKISILGTGLIGCEFANDLSNAGFKVDLIGPDKTPLERFIPPEVGLLLQSALEKNGVTFHLGVLPQKIDKCEEGYLIHLSTGEMIKAEFVLSAIGLKPHLELAKSAGIQTDRGILVNRYLECSVPDIYAIGDCAEVEGHVLPFIAPILNCARALSKTLAGERTEVIYPAMPVTVKTPAHPIVICPPPKNIEGNWEIEVKEGSARALFFDCQKHIYGFVLTNDAVKERAQLAKTIPNLF